MIPIRRANLARPDTKSATSFVPPRLANAVGKFPAILTHPAPKEAHEAIRSPPVEAKSPKLGLPEVSPVQLRAPPSKIRPLRAPQPQLASLSKGTATTELKTMHLQTEYPIFLAQWETEGGRTLDTRYANRISNYEQNQNHVHNDHSHHPAPFDTHGSVGNTCPGKVRRFVSDQ